MDAELYEEACFIRDRIQSLMDESNTSSWRDLGVLDWLVDRVDDLGFSIPTPIQARAAETILRSRAASCSLQAPTGSGKTLAFLLPCLSLLSYPPETYPEDLESPQLVIVVPTRELGVQIAMIVFRLFGGSVASDGIPGNRSNMFRYTGPRGVRVKGLVLEDEVDQAVEQRYLYGAHVVVGTPKLIAEAMARGVKIIGSDCRAIVVDEADACFKEDDIAASKTILDAVRELPVESASASASASGEKPRVVMAGATLSQDVFDLAVRNRWIEPGSFVQVDISGATTTERGADASSSASPASSSTSPPSPPPPSSRPLDGKHKRSSSPLVSSRLRHRYVTTNDSDMLGMLCRTILADQKSHSLDSQPTRGIVYVADSAVARKISEPLRSVLWSRHDISVLLPQGEEPIKSLHAFRDNRTSLLIATLAASRGLDLPAVTHVYFVGVLPPADEYVHLCGRLGRIGSSDAGVMTTFIETSAEPEFRAMLEDLRVPDDSVEKLDPPMPRSIEDLGALEGDDDAIDEAKRALETILALSKDEPEDRGTGDIRE